MKIISSGMTAAKYQKILVEEYGINDSAGLSILEAGLRCYERAEEYRKQIKKDGLMVPSATGGTQKHPLLATERDNRALWLSALRQLNFDVIPAQNGPGRPPGR